MSEYISNLNLINHIRDDLNNLTGMEKLASIMLVSRRNTNTLQCNPSHKKIAEDMGVCRRTSINTIKSLVDKGIITKFKDAYKSNHYLFYWDIHKSLEMAQENDNCRFTEEEIERHCK